jgi:hypothetical protein
VKIVLNHNITSRFEHHSALCRDQIVNFCQIRPQIPSFTKAQWLGAENEDGKQTLNTDHYTGCSTFMHAVCETFILFYQLTVKVSEIFAILAMFSE